MSFGAMCGYIYQRVTLALPGAIKGGTEAVATAGTEHENLTRLPELMPPLKVDEPDKPQKQRR